MSFAEETGRKRIQRCAVCGTDVEHEELRHFDKPSDRFGWHAIEHRAPCGAHCAGGGCDHGEQDVHTPAFDACPRCGAIDTEVARIIERPDSGERAVFHRYTADHRRGLGYRVDLEQRDGDLWRVVSRWQVHHPESYGGAYRQACFYVSWLKQIPAT